MKRKMRLTAGGRCGQAGFSLLEVVFAVAILMGVLAVTARGLSLNYGSMVLQNQRTQAINNCRAVMTDIRNVIRTATTDEVCTADVMLFPCNILSWRNTFPMNKEDYNGLSTANKTKYASLFTLADQEYSVSFTDATGAEAESGTVAEIEVGTEGEGTTVTEISNTNPVYVTVTTHWTGPKGITYVSSLRSIVTDR